MIKVWGGSSWFGPTTTSICQNQKLTLHCGHGRVIKIRHANYGRTNYFTCPRGNLHTDDCESSDTKEIVKKRCNGRRKCTLTATNSIFGNPCHGTTKYLEVTFKCIRKLYYDFTTKSGDLIYFFFVLIDSIEYPYKRCAGLLIPVPR